MATEYRVQSGYFISNVASDYPHDPVDHAASIKEYLDDQLADDFELSVMDLTTGKWVFIKKTLL